MRIAIFSDTFFPEINGVSKVAEQSATGLSKLGHEATLYVASSYSTKKLRALKSQGIIRLPSTPLFVYPGLRLTIPVGRAIGKISKNKFRPDIIHSHTSFGAGLEALVSAKVFRIPLIGTHHTFFDHYLKHVGLDYAWARKLSWIITVGYYNRCDLIISPSNTLAKELQDNGLKKKVLSLQNAIDPIFFSRLPDKNEKGKLKEDRKLGEVAFIYMGRLSYEKNIDEVLKAFALFLKENKKATLTITGDGPERKKLEALSQELRITDNTRFTGALRGKDLLDELHSADIFLTAAASENMPLSVLEAMASGLPVIAVNEKGLPEIVKDSENGFLVPSGKPEAMTEKMLHLSKDKELTKKFSEGSRQMSLNHSDEIVTKKLAEIYEEVIREYKNK